MRKEDGNNERRDRSLLQGEEVPPLPAVVPAQSLSSALLEEDLGGLNLGLLSRFILVYVYICMGSPVLSLCFLCFSVNLMEVDRQALETAKEVEVEAVMEEDPGEEVETVVEEEVGAALVEEVALEEEVGAAVKKEVEGHPSPSRIPQNLVALTYKVRGNSKVEGGEA